MSTVAPTSAQALRKISHGERRTLTDLIESVVAQAQRSGSKDLSMREVQAELLRAYGRQEELSTISGRVNALVESKRLLRDKINTRRCTITGQTIQPLSVPPVQERLCY
jgi:hypothetical protein